MTKKGRDGAEAIQNMMKNFRENPPKELSGSPVAEVKDFKEQTNFVVAENATKVMNDIPKSNVLIYYTEDGTKVCVRPSGTEPKIKFYVSVKDSLASKEEFENKIKALEEKIQQIKVNLQLD